MQDLEAHARYGLSRFPEYSGFLSGALHKNADGTRIVQYLRWESEANYQACVSDPQWESGSSSQRFLALVASGEVRMDVKVYEIVATAGNPRPH